MIDDWNQVAGYLSNAANIYLRCAVGGLLDGAGVALPFLDDGIGAFCDFHSVLF
jgi:hypothetical protein